MEKTRKEKVDELKKFHQSTFDTLSVSDPYFVAKMAYTPRGKTEPHVGFFESEFKKETDVYMEFVDKQVVPEDPDRTLYRWKYNKFWKEEYEESKTGENTFFLIPVSELIAINISSKAITPPGGMIVGDMSLNELTVKDFAAIVWKKPISDKTYINNLIISN